MLPNENFLMARLFKLVALIDEAYENRYGDSLYTSADWALQHRIASARKKELLDTVQLCLGTEYAIELEQKVLDKINEDNARKTLDTPPMS